jgi:hypothetical protein
MRVSLNFLRKLIPGRASLETQSNDETKSNPYSPTTSPEELSQKQGSRLSDEELAKLISQKLRSRKIEDLRSTSSLSENYITKVVLDYFLLNRDNSEFDQYIDQIKSLSQRKRLSLELNDSDHNEILFNTVKRRLQLHPEETILDRKKVLEYFLETYNQNGFVFHGFNGVFEDSIKENGLDPTKRSWDTTESAKMLSILKRHNAERLVGCYEQTADKIYFSSETSTCRHYAKSSPEWFNRMCSTGGTDDYEKEKRNVDIRTQKMPAADRDFIRSLFAKYWQKFTGEKAKPKLALIKRSALGINQLTDDEIKAIEDNFLGYVKEGPICDSGGNITYERSINDALRFSMGHYPLYFLNSAYTQRIDPKDIHIVDLVDR